jgi:(2Fe-2S) ferredoxin
VFEYRSLKSLVFVGFLVSAGASLSAQQTGARLQTSKPVAQQAAGPKALISRLASTSRSAISLAAGDFFEDGANGLVTGYSVGDGGMIAVQQGSALPSNENLDASAFTQAAKFIDVGLRPDILKSTDLNTDGHQDLVAASRGGSSFVVLQGDGRGGFALQSPVAVGGAITTVAPWKNAAGQQKVAVGVCNGGCSVEIYNADGSKYAAVALESVPKILEVARVSGRPTEDLIVGDGSTLSLINGQRLASTSPRIDRLPISGAVAAAVGSFVFDRRGGLPQIAVLTSDGAIHVLARTGLVPTPAAGSLSIPGGRGHSTVQPEIVDPLNLPWFDAETLSGIAAPDSDKAILLATHLSGSGMEDLLALNVNSGGRVAIGHPILPSLVQPGEPRQPAQVLPARVTNEGSSTGRVLGALPMRVSQDARYGLVTAEGTAQPMIAQLAAYHTYTVNVASDAAVTSAMTTACTNGSAGCSLRAAMALVNTDASAAIAAGKADTINLPAGTVFLTYNSTGSGVDSNGNYNYHIEVNGPFNLLGAGAALTYITTNNADKIFSINPGYTQSQIPFSVFFSNLTMYNGTNKNNPSNNANANDVGGLLDYDTAGTGNITFANCNFTNATDGYGEGGAIFVSDNIVTESGFGSGTLEVDGGTFSGNSSSERGGAISTSTNENYGYVPIVINGVTFTGNSVNHALNSGDTYTTGYGGAIDFGRDTITGKTPTILNSTFSGNSTTFTSGHGLSEGGALAAFSGMTITNSVFSGNTTVTSGGAIEMAVLDYAPTLTGLTITGNTSADSGGIEIDAGSPGGLASTLQYSRISGNTGGSTRSGLGVGALGEADANATVTATYNFWGCNGAATGTGCNTAAEDSGSGTLTLTPYAQVTASLSSTTPTPGTSLTLNGGITTDSNNAALSNVNAFTGVAGSSSSTSSGATVTNPGGTVIATLKITENSTQLATATGATNSSGAAAALSTTVSASGSGTGTVTIDNATATVSFSVTVASPTISNAFSPTSVLVGVSSTLTFTLTNPNTNISATGVAFSDSLPSGLTVATTPAIANNCGGTLTATAGSGSITLSGATINASSNCTISVNVTPSTTGSKNNQTGNITSTNETASGTTSNTATLTVTAPPPAVTGLSPTSGYYTGGGTITITGTNFTGATAVKFGATSATGVNVVNDSQITATIPAGTAGQVYVTVTTSFGTSPNSSQYTYVGNINTFSVTGFPTTAILSESGTVTVTALDVNGVTDRFYTGTVHFTTSDPSGTLPANYTFVTGDAGVHTFTVTLNTLGTQSITATDTVTSSATGSQTGILARNAVWAVNPLGTLSKLNGSGAAILGPVGTSGTSSTVGGLAFDSTGNAWSVTAANNALDFIGKLGTGAATYSGGGLNAPVSVIVDGLGKVWVANSTGNSVSVFSSAGAAISPATTGYQSAYQSSVYTTPGGITIDISGNVWVTNSGNNTVNEIIGGAAPIAPLATALTNSTTGARP